MRDLAVCAFLRSSKTSIIKGGVVPTSRRHTRTLSCSYTLHILVGLSDANGVLLYCVCSIVYRLPRFYRLPLGNIMIIRTWTCGRSHTKHRRLRMDAHKKCDQCMRDRWFWCMEWSVCTRWWHHLLSFYRVCIGKGTSCIYWHQMLCSCHCSCHLHKYTNTIRRTHTHKYNTHNRATAPKRTWTGKISQVVVTRSRSTRTRDCEANKRLRRRWNGDWNNEK